MYGPNHFNAPKSKQERYKAENIASRNQACSILGVSLNASEEEIKRAYRLKARQFHPDSNRDNPNAEEMIKEVNSAYELLMNPDSFDQYGNVTGANAVRNNRQRQWQQYPRQGASGVDFEDFFEPFEQSSIGQYRLRTLAKFANEFYEIESAFCYFLNNSLRNLQTIYDSNFEDVLKIAQNDTKSSIKDPEIKRLFLAWARENHKGLNGGKNSHNIQELYQLLNIKKQEIINQKTDFVNKLVEAVVGFALPQWILQTPPLNTVGKSIEYNTPQGKLIEQLNSAELRYKENGSELVYSITLKDLVEGVLLGKISIERGNSFLPLINKRKKFVNDYQHKIGDLHSKLEIRKAQVERLKAKFSQGESLFKRLQLLRKGERFYYFRERYIGSFPELSFPNIYNAFYSESFEKISQRTFNEFDGISKNYRDFAFSENSFSEVERVLEKCSSFDYLEAQLNGEIQSLDKYVSEEEVNFKILSEAIKTVKDNLIKFENSKREIENYLNENIDFARVRTGEIDNFHDRISNFEGVSNDQKANFYPKRNIEAQDTALVQELKRSISQYTSQYNSYTRRLNGGDIEAEEFNKILPDFQELQKLASDVSSAYERLNKFRESIIASVSDGYQESVMAQLAQIAEKNNKEREQRVDEQSAQNVQIQVSIESNSTTSTQLEEPQVAQRVNPNRPAVRISEKAVIAELQKRIQERLNQAEQVEALTDANAVKQAIQRYHLVFKEARKLFTEDNSASPNILVEMIDDINRQVDSLDINESIKSEYKIPDYNIERDQKLLIEIKHILIIYRYLVSPFIKKFNNKAFNQDDLVQFNNIHKHLNILVSEIKLKQIALTSLRKEVMFKINSFSINEIRKEAFKRSESYERPTGSPLYGAYTTQYTGNASQENPISSQTKQEIKPKKKVSLLKRLDNRINNLSIRFIGRRLW
jgi:curved DNA-binding protein CbpA